MTPDADEPYYTEETEETHWQVSRFASQERSCEFFNFESKYKDSSGFKLAVTVWFHGYNMLSRPNKKNR